ncbi:bacteriohemerythrin [Candidatus Latescibacterota bacterium]
MFRNTTGNADYVFIKGDKMRRTFAEWKEDYKIGITEVDEQHISLVKLINDLHAGLSLNGKVNRTATFKSAAKEAVEYVKNHFNTEEKYMIQSKYPGLKEQQEMHKDFIIALISNVKSYEYNNMRAPVELLIFLKNWLLEHIAVEDKKIGQFIQQNNFDKKTSD